MKRLLHLLILCFPLLTSAQVVNLEGAKIVQYKQIADTKLYLHLFNPSNHKVSDQRPVIIFFFGGC